MDVVGVAGGVDGPAHARPWGADEGEDRRAHERELAAQVGATLVAMAERVRERQAGPACERHVVADDAHAHLGDFQRGGRVRERSTRRRCEDAQQP
jgi:hypothetical protein